MVASQDIVDNELAKVLMQPHTLHRFRIRELCHGYAPTRVAPSPGRHSGQPEALLLETVVYYPDASTQ